MRAAICASLILTALLSAQAGFTGGTTAWQPGLVQMLETAPTEAVQHSPMALMTPETHLKDFMPAYLSQQEESSLG